MNALLKNILIRLPLFKKFKERKYIRIGLGLYIINWIFKRVLKVNSGDALVHFTSKVSKPENITIHPGEDQFKVYLSFAASGGCYYQAYNGIEVGPGTIWAYGCKFISTNHDFQDYDKPTISDPIRIGKRVWLGANVVVLPGVQIGDFTIVGAGTVVTKNIPANHIAAGTPARIIAKRCLECHCKIDKDRTYCNRHKGILNKATNPD